MELLRDQRPGGQLLPGVDLRGQEGAGVHLPVGLPAQRGGGAVGGRRAGQVTNHSRPEGHVTTSSPPIGCRSRKLSILQRPFNNHCLTFALVFETLLAFLLIYMPGNTEVSLHIFNI